MSIKASPIAERYLGYDLDITDNVIDPRYTRTINWLHTKI